MQIVHFKRCDSEEKINLLTFFFFFTSVDVVFEKRSKTPILPDTLPTRIPLLIKMFLFVSQMHHPIQMKPADSENRSGKCVFFRKPFIKLTPTAARARDVDCTTLIVVGRSRFSGSPESLSLLLESKFQFPADSIGLNVYTHGPSVCVHGLRAYAAECRAGTLFSGAAERKRRSDANSPADTDSAAVRTAP